MRAASKQLAHMTSSFPLKGTSRSECLSKKAMEQRSNWPRTFPPQEKNPRSIGFLSLASSPSSSGIPETSTRSKRTILATPPSLATRLRGVTGMQGGSNTPLVATPLWPSVGVKPNTPKVGDLESSGTPECLEFYNKAQNTLH
jgi:hypothetical protein